MKKIITLLIFVLSFSLFTACDDDEDTLTFFNTVWEFSSSSYYDYSSYIGTKAWVFTQGENQLKECTYSTQTYNTQLASVDTEASTVTLWGSYVYNIAMDGDEKTLTLTYAYDSSQYIKFVKSSTVTSEDIAGYTYSTSKAGLYQELGKLVTE